MSSGHSRNLTSNPEYDDLVQIFKVFLGRRGVKDSDLKFHSSRPIYRAMQHIASSKEFRERILPIIVSDNSGGSDASQSLDAESIEFLYSMDPAGDWGGSTTRFQALNKLALNPKLTFLRQIIDGAVDAMASVPTTVDIEIAIFPEPVPSHESFKDIFEIAGTGPAIPEIIPSWQNLLFFQPSGIATCREFFLSSEVGSVESKKHQVELKTALQQVELTAEELMVTPIPVMVHSKNPETYVEDTKSQGKNLPLISLTTISTRLGRVRHTIETLYKQEENFHSINLYVSNEPYLIDEGIHSADANLKILFDMGVNIYFVPNIGPYRKFQYIILQLQKAGAEDKTVIVTVDDDVLYPPNIIGQLAGACSMEDCVAAHRGREILYADGELQSYNSFAVPCDRRSSSNLANGRNGVAYQLGFFPKSPKLFIGPILAPTADDLWCKWVTGFYCIPTTILEPEAAYKPELDFDDTDVKDKTSLYHKYNAKGTNDIAIKALEKYFESKGASLSQIYGGN